MNDLNKALPETIQKAYELTDQWVGGTKQLFGTGRLINLETLTTNQAKYLVSVGKMKEKSTDNTAASKKTASK